MVRLIPVDPGAVEVALDVSIDIPAVALVGMDGGELVGTGGLAWGRGRCWVWFHVKQQKPAYALVAFKAFKRLIKRAKQLGETEIYAIRDPQYPTSERLCRLCGFEFLGVEDGREIHICRLGDTDVRS